MINKPRCQGQVLKAARKTGNSAFTAPLAKAECGIHIDDKGNPAPKGWQMRPGSKLVLVSQAEDGWMHPAIFEKEYTRTPRFVICRTVRQLFLFCLRSLSKSDELMFAEAWASIAHRSCRVSSQTITSNKPRFGVCLKSHFITEYCRNCSWRPQSPPNRSWVCHCAETAAGAPLEDFGR